jgi:concanavalin A-like lectin/glucanase superfamily protein
MELSVRALGTDGILMLRGCTDPVTNPDTMLSAPFPRDGAWHFVRAVHRAAELDVCIDGVHVVSLPVQATTMSNNPPVLGKPVVDDEGAVYVGGFDDVRAFTGALPCR